MARTRRAARRRVALDPRRGHLESRDPPVRQPPVHDHGSHAAVLAGRESRGGCRRSRGAGLGEADVELSAGAAVGRTRAEMGAGREDLRPGRAAVIATWYQPCRRRFGLMAAALAALLLLGASRVHAADLKPDAYLAKLAAARIPADAAAVVIKPLDDGPLRWSANDKKPMNPASTMKL